MFTSVHQEHRLAGISAFKKGSTFHSWITKTLHAQQDGVTRYGQPHLTHGMDFTAYSRATSKRDTCCTYTDVHTHNHTYTHTGPSKHDLVVNAGMFILKKRVPLVFLKITWFTVVPGDKRRAGKLGAPFFAVVVSCCAAPVLKSSDCVNT